MLPNWNYVRDCYNGVTEIKKRGKEKTYLHKFPSETDNRGDESYRLRMEMADFDNIFQTAINSMVGIMNKDKAQVRFDAGNEEITAKEVRDLDVYGNAYGDRLQGLQSRLTFAQTLVGRQGLLLDIETNQFGLEPRFVIKEYSAECILDGEVARSLHTGSKQLQWIVLDETTEEFDPKTKARLPITRYRILGLDEQGYYYTATIEGLNVENEWTTFNFKKPTHHFYPQFKGDRLRFIPFTVCNVDRLGFDQWQMPPFIDMAYSTINAYNIDSLYKRSLVNYSSPTLVLSNMKATGKLALGGVMELQSERETNSSVTLLETSGSGLNQFSACITQIKADALRRTVQGMLESAGANSSGEALLLRMAAGTATIAQIHTTAQNAILEQLCYAARWTGATQDEAAERIDYKVNTTYMGNATTLSEIVGIMAANHSVDGKILSKRNLYSLLQSVSPELSSYEDNELQIEEETANQAAPINQIDTETLKLYFQQQANANNELDTDESDDDQDDDDTDDDTDDKDDKDKNKKI
jgi:hypothetical protein